jgi:predicted ATPase/class 3 adenylate cyclase
VIVRSRKHTRDPAPVGIVTLVFTDVQGSTTLWDRHTAAMREALATHNKVIRQLLDQAGGYEVKSEGDAFMAAFATPLQAAWFCLRAQQGLLDADWPGEILEQENARSEEVDGAVLFRGLRVRMGIHMGAPDCRPDPRTGRMDYLGPVTNRAARIAHAGHGGQILVSETVRRELDGQLERLDKPVLRELGAHRLRDIDTPERLTELVPAALEGRRFPPLRAREESRRPLPAPNDRFLGRQRELAELTRRLTGGDRLVSLVGTGGVGKSRLAVELGRTLARDDVFNGGVFFIDLTEARTIYGACHIVGTALGVPLDEATEAETVEHLGRAMAGRGDALFILDNVEQMVAIAPDTLRVWLERAQASSFLITTRERVRLRGESAMELSPLPTPDDDDDVGPAVDLFLDRARRARPALELTAPELRAVREIVRQLDGIPLAIELAAARMRVLTPRGLLSRLPARFELLKDNHRTMREALDWSWQLLSPEEQTALAQSAVFVGGFTLEAAEAVLETGGELDRASPVIDVIEALRDKSLLRAEARDGELRFSLFQTIREYALLHLDDEGRTRARHASFFARLGARRVEELEGGGGVPALRALVREGENLVAAHVHDLERGDLERALESLIALEPVFTTRGPLGVFVDLCEQALEEGASGAPARLRARAYLSRARARHAGGDLANAHADLKRALRRARKAKLKGLEGRVLTELGALNHDLGRDETAHGLYESALAALVDHPLLEGRALRNLGVLFRQRGRRDKAAEYLDLALARHAATGDRLTEGVTRAELAALAHDVGDLAGAHASYNAALDIHREVGDLRREGVVLSNLGALYQEQGRQPHAERCYREAVERCRDAGDRRALGVTLGLMGGLEFERGSADQARERYREGALLCREVRYRRGEGVILARWGAADAALDDFEAAEEHFDAAELLLEGLGDSHLLEALALLRGHLDLAEARVLAGKGAVDAADRARRNASRRVAEVVATKKRARSLDADVRISGNAVPLLAPTAPTATQTLAIQNDEVRFALRSLEAALDDADLWEGATTG